MMDPGLQKLKDLIADVRYNGDQHTDIKVKENDPSATLRTLNIKTTNGDWFMFDPDRGRGASKKMSPILSVGTSYEHHKACDAVILVKNCGEQYALFIELKSSSRQGGFKGQLRSTRCFLKYLLYIAEEFHSVQFPIIKERFIVFHSTKSKKTTLSKKPTIFQRTSVLLGDPNNPRKEIISDGATFYLKDLLN